MNQRKSFLLTTLVVSLFWPMQARAARSASTMVSWYSSPRGATRMQAASRFLPCGSVLLVWNTRDRRSKKWRVVVTDYGPFVSGRQFDLSPYAFRRVFGSTRKGVCRMSYRVIKRGRKCRVHRH